MVPSPYGMELSNNLATADSDIDEIKEAGTNQQLLDGTAVSGGTIKAKMASWKVALAVIVLLSCMFGIIGLANPFAQLLYEAEANIGTASALHVGALERPEARDKKLKLEDLETFERYIPEPPPPLTAADNEPQQKSSLAQISAPLSPPVPPPAPPPPPEPGPEPEPASAHEGEQVMALVHKKSKPWIPYNTWMKATKEALAAQMTQPSVRASVLAPACAECREALQASRLHSYGVQFCPWMAVQPDTRYPRVRGSPMSRDGTIYKQLATMSAAQEAGGKNLFMPFGGVGLGAVTAGGSHGNSDDGDIDAKSLCKRETTVAAECPDLGYGRSYWPERPGQTPEEATAEMAAVLSNHSAPGLPHHSCFCITG